MIPLPNYYYDKARRLQEERDREQWLRKSGVEGPKGKMSPHGYHQAKEKAEERLRSKHRHHGGDGQYRGDRSGHCDCDDRRDDGRHDEARYTKNEHNRGRRDDHLRYERPHRHAEGHKNGDRKYD